MLIRMLSTAIGPDCRLIEGEKCEVETKRAKDLIAGGYAVDCKADAAAAEKAVQKQAKAAEGEGGEAKPPAK